MIDARRPFPKPQAGAAIVALSLLLPIGSQANEEGAGRHAAADAVVEVIARNTTKLKRIVVIDHSRLAEKEGVKMPPSVVTIYSDPRITSALMKENPRVGLDLPQKILAFEEAGKVRVAFPRASFLAARHGVGDEAALRLYQDGVDLGLRGIDAESMDPVTDEGVTRDFGISELVSDLGYADTIKRLKEAVMKQGDTVWFGDIDLHAEAAKEGVDLPCATLLLFGGPKPGGVAMAKFPKLGLDARLRGQQGQGAGDLQRHREDGRTALRRECQATRSHQRASCRHLRRSCTHGRQVGPSSIIQPPSPEPE